MIEHKVKDLQYLADKSVQYGSMQALVVLADKSLRLSALEHLMSLICKVVGL